MMKRPSGFDEVSQNPASKRQEVSAGSTVSKTPKQQATGSSKTQQSQHQALRAQRQAVLEEHRRAERLLAEEQKQRARDRKQQRRQDKADLKRFTQERRTRRRRLLLGLAAFLGLALLVLVLVVSPIFAVKKIEITGAQNLDTAELEARLKSSFSDTPLALVNRSELVDILNSYPLIESFLIENRLPDTLVLRIVERRPLLAVANASGGFAVLDSAGVALAGSVEPPEGLPLFQVPATGGGVTTFDAAVEVLLALSAELRAEIETITATSRSEVSFVLRGSAADVMWGGSDQSELKTRVLAALMEAAPKAKLYDVSSPTNPITK